MKNWTLSKKISLGFTVLTVLLIGMGLLSLSSMKRVGEISNRMETTYLPMLDLGQKLKINTILALDEFEDYYKTKNPKSFQGSKERLEMLNGFSSRGLVLSKEKNLTEFYDTLVLFQKAQENFGRSVGNILKANRTFDSLQMRISKLNRSIFQAAPAVMQNFQKSMNVFLNSDIIEASSIRQLVKEIGFTCQLLLNLLEIRSLNWHFQIRNDREILDGTKPRIEATLKVISKLLGRNTDNSNNGKLNEIDKDFQNLRDSFVELGKSENLRKEILIEVAQLSRESLALAEKIMVGGNSLALSGANDTDQEVIRASRGTAFGLILTFFLAISISWYLSSTTTKTLDKLKSEASTLVQGAVDGNLSIRGKAKEVNFEFRSLIESINNLLNAVERPIRVTSEYIQFFAMGEVPPPITETYKGEFNEIKKSLNLLINAVQRPIMVTSDYVRRISLGELPPEIAEDFSGEFNEIKKSINLLIISSGQISDAAQTIAKGDLTLSIKMRSDKDELISAMIEMVKHLRGMVSEVKGGIQSLASSSTELAAIAAQSSERTSVVASISSTVAAAAEEMTVNASGVAERMDQAAENLASVVVSTDEMTRTVSDLANNSQNARKISSMAVSQADSVVQLMKELGRAAQEISVVTETISNVSAQTKMLALNATIEATRAGAAGKGFAVVANEIKELAKQTSTATEDIKKRVEGIQSSTNSAVQDIDKISHVIGDVSEIVISIAASLEQQSAVAENIASNITQASMGIKEANEQVGENSKVCQSITKDIISVTTSATELEEAGKQVNSSARELSKLAEQLDVLIQKFKI